MAKMSDEQKPQAQLIQELHTLRRRVAELEGSENRLQEMTMFSRVGAAISAAEDTISALQNVCAEMARFLNVPQSSFAILNPQRTAAEVVATYQPPGSPSSIGVSIPVVGNPSMSYILEHKTHLAITDAQADPLLAPIHELMRQWNIQSILIVPIVVDGEVIGTLGFDAFQRRVFTDSEIDLVQRVASRVGQVLLRKRAEAEIVKLNRELTALNEVDQALISALDLQETLTIIIDRTIELLGAAAASVVLRDEVRGDLCFVAASGEGADFVRNARFELGQGIAGWVIQHGEAVIVSDVMEDERFFSDFDEKSGLTTRSILCAPLQVKGQVIGAIEVMNKERGTFDEKDLRFLTSIASPAATAIENARLFGESQAHAKELAVLNELSQALTARLSVEEVLEEAYRQIARLVDTTNFYIGLYDEEKKEVAIPFMVSKSEIDRQIVIVPVDQGFTGYIIRNRTSVLVEEDVVEWLEEQGIDAVGEPSLSWLGVPLITGDQVLGMMAVQSYTTPRLYDEHDLDLLTAIAGSTAIAIQNARLYEQAQREITERKRAEEALSHEQYLLNALMDNVPDHIYFKDAEGRFTRINKAYAEQFGLSDPAQVVGKTDFDFLTEEHAQSAYE
ncbi:MAG: GAF domain-containing protein, partial [Chloroflexota bacterium]|nr:GAF domain-containing protein [Chloroflexota bacterium]